MSIHVREVNGKKKYEVSYRSGRQRTETYSRKVDAEKRDTEIRLAKERGEPIPRRGHGGGKETLKTFARDQWWPTEVSGAGLSLKTQERYATFLDKHLIPRIGDELLTSIDVQMILELRASLAKDKVPDYTAARTLKLLRQILHFAVIVGKLPSNPADVLSRPKMLPKQTRKDDLVPLYADEIEAIRAAILAGESPWKLRNAAMVSLYGYAGVRPLREGVELTWAALGADSLKVSAGKTGRSRIVPELIVPLLDDLAAWKAVAPSTAKTALIFPAEGGEWTQSALNNWRNRIFSPLAPDGATPYSLRHGYALMLAREGVDDRDAADRMGHSLTMHNQHYGGFIRALRGRPRESMGAAAKRARGALVLPKAA